MDLCGGFQPAQHDHARAGMAGSCGSMAVLIRLVSDNGTQHLGRLRPPSIAMCARLVNGWLRVAGRCYH